MNLQNIPRIQISTDQKSVLSFAQDRLWFIEHYAYGTNAYHLPLLFELGEGTNVDGIKFALQSVISRHEILLSTFEQNEALGGATQKVHNELPDIAEKTANDYEDLQTKLKTDINKPFNLERDYPVRISIYRIVTEGRQPNINDRVVLLLNFHHIACDEWSLDIFYKELTEYYNHWLNNETAFELPSPTIQYKDYACWQRSYFNGEPPAAQLNYWKEKLSGYQSLELPLDFSRPATIDYDGAKEEISINKKTSSKLRNLARQYGASLHSVLLSSVSILLGKYTGQEDIITGSLNPNRSNKQTEELIGLFANTLVNRAILSQNQSFGELIRQVHKDLIEAQAHQDLPFEKLVDELDVERDPSRHPLFQVMFGMKQLGGLDHNTKSKNSYLRKIKTDGLYNVERFDISIFIDDSEEELSCEFSYAASLFREHTISNLCLYFSNLLEQLVSYPEKPYSQFCLITQTDYFEVVDKWNNTEKYYPADKTLHGMFGEQVVQTPDAIALVYEGVALTYKQLNQYANQLAHEIKNRYKQNTGWEFQAETLIAIYTGRSLEMVIGILAILKAGGAYVPMDVQYPQERIDFMLSDTEAKLILTLHRGNEKYTATLPEDKLIYIDLDEDLYSTKNTDNPKTISRATNLAYIIYTSGTTGTAKGVMIEHKSSINTAVALFDIYDPNTVRRVTAYTSYVFDVSVSEIFVSLFQGLELHILSDEIKTDSLALSEYFLENKINLVYLPPVLLAELPAELYPDLKRIIYAGEPCNRETAKLWSSDYELYNYYGPTELTIYATGKQIKESEVEQIGTPIQNYKAYILDTMLHPVPTGVVGELYFSGAGLARGYLNRPELTEERFIPNLFATEQDKQLGYTRLYKTGDLVRRLPDGNLELKGRNDNQIKIRGFRVELGEIENAIVQFNGVKQCCVLLASRADKSKFLAAYYVLKSGINTTSQNDIREYLAHKLPAYMIPAVFCELMEMPLTPNGKLDKRALPLIEYSEGTNEYTPPKNETEQTICDIWQDALGQERISVTDDFFKIGGDSILSIRVSGKMRRAGFNCHVRDIFEFKTVRVLAEKLVRNIDTDPTVTEQGALEGSIKLTRNQQMLISADFKLVKISQPLLDRLTGSANADKNEIEQIYPATSLQQGFIYHSLQNAEDESYRVQMLFDYRQQLDTDKYIAAWELCIEEFPIFRTTFNWEEEIIQIIYKKGKAAYFVHDISHLTTQNERDQAIASIQANDRKQPFDLTRPTLLRLHIIKQSEEFYTVIKNEHHSITDGWSQPLLTARLNSHYQALVAGEHISIVPDNAYLETQEYICMHSEQVQLYWDQTLSVVEVANDINPLLSKPIDQLSYKGMVQHASSSLEITGNFYDRLKAFCRNEGVTLNVAIQFVWHKIIQVFSYSTLTVVGTTVSGRELPVEGIEESVGFYINTLPLVVDWDNDQTIAEQLHLIQQKLADLNQNSFASLAKMQKNAERIFQSMFVFENFNSPEEHSDEANVTFRNLVYGIDYPIGIKATEQDGKLTIDLVYDGKYLSNEKAQKHLSTIENVFQQIIETPYKPHTEISLLTAEEFQKIVYKWNNTASSFPDDKTISQLFSLQAAKTPQNIAVEFEGSQITYSELESKSDALAKYIRAQYRNRVKTDIEPGTMVALFAERGIDMIVGMIAIAKSGGAYVPMDINYPQERIDHILADTRAELILSQRHIVAAGKNNLPSDRIIYIDSAETSGVEEIGDTTFEIATAADLAYVIYTSGTTGLPKGVEIRHSGMINLCWNFVRGFNITESTTASQLISVSFDAAVAEIFPPLIVGGKLLIVPDRIKQSYALAEFLKNTEVSHLTIPSDLLGQLEWTELPKLVSINVGGGVPTVQSLEKWYHNRILMNTYGPTEISVCATMHQYRTGDLNTNIGKPLYNTTAFILSKKLVPVPVGVAGELYIGGAGVARGYLNRTDLTKERFIKNPFASATEKATGKDVFYKTGDLVKWMDDGSIEFAGRNDDQVKIRGYRIEPGEIEHVLNHIPGIRQSCVIARERNSDAGSIKYLVGYYVLDNNYISTDYSNILDSWESLYDGEYEKGVEEEKVESDFGGWNSYITGAAIPLEEMKEWRNHILKNIEHLNPKNVLEVGVGSGLLMYPLLKQVSKYTGLDISRSVIQRHTRHLKETENDTEFYHLKAHQTDQLPAGAQYDTIIINSVCQYFPNIGYFAEVLEKALNRLTENGTLFLGDIRNFDCLKDLIKDRLDYQGEQFEQLEIDRMALKENELLISPDYFLELAKKNEFLCVEVMERKAGYVNELSKYRFDVRISINRERLSGSKEIVLNATNAISAKNYNTPFLNQLGKNEIVTKLSAVLPPYMVPDHLVPLEAFPLTLNGKLNKKTLPDPEFNSGSEEYVAPATEIESTVCTIWKRVLGLDTVGITDNFFKIGGNSILAIQVSHKMSHLLGSDIKVSDIFKYKTIALILRTCLQDQQISIQKTETNSAVLSFAQERLWFIELYEQGSNAYHMPAVYELEKSTDIEGIKYALQKIASRHEVLRSTIQYTVGEKNGLQIVHEDELQIEETEFADFTSFEQRLKQDVNQPFNLNIEYPVRAKLYFVGNADAPTDKLEYRTILLVNMHHIASDGWSMDIFQKELYAFYESYCDKSNNNNLPPLEIQYKDFSVWQRKYLTGDTLQKQLNYWSQALSGFSNLELPTDYTRPTRINYAGTSEKFAIDKDVSLKLRVLARQWGVTLQSVMLGSFNILLGKYTGQYDIITGSPNANRHHRQTEGLIGFFVNTVANRTQLRIDQSFEDLVQQIHQEQIQAQLHQDLPFEKLVDELKVERDTSRHPIFQVMFSVQNFGNQNSANQQGRIIRPLANENLYNIEKFDLSVTIDDSRQELAGLISYATSLFRKTTITRLISHYNNLLRQLIALPNAHYSSINIMDEEEYDTVVHKWNSTEKYYPKEKTIIQSFEEQVEANPSNCALICEGKQMSFSELNERSNQLARHIRQLFKERNNYELKPDTLIALYIERSIEMVIAIIAVLKSGAAYVPMDVSYPQERIDFLLADTQAPIILNLRRQKTKINLPEDKVICVDLSETIYTGEPANQLIAVDPKHLAYVIYTSGTTGKPKGVMAEHGAFAQFVYNFNDRLWTETNTRFSGVLSLTNYVFDIFGLEYALPLITGTTITLSSIDKVSDDDITEHQIIQQTPGSLFHFAANFSEKLKTNICLVGGEALSSNVAARLLQSFNRVYNVYGPAETVIWSTINEVTDPATPFIGKPLYNEQVYVLDSQLMPVPIGVTGELYIGGAGLAKGYLNLPDLTKERFIANPFAIENDRSRLYKTGDLVRWTENGILEFIGRNDDQVKVRGHRIELGEVANALSQITGILDSCVLAKVRATGNSNEKYLAAYYIPDPQAGNITDDIIKSELLKVLPEYMLPDAFIAMTAFPLTVNGKLDKKAMPDPGFQIVSESYTPPGTDVEQSICSLWQEVLGIDRVGITDDFFRIGGNSISAIQVSHMMSRNLKCELRVADIFKYKSIAQLLQHSIGQEMIIIPRTDAQSAIVSFAQERIWFIEQYEQGTNAYHMPLLFEIEKRSDIDGVKYAVQKIVSRHEVLRSTIEQNDSQKHAAQVVHNEPLVIEEVSVADEVEFETILKQDVNRHFLLSAEYPIRVVIYRIGTERTRMLVNIHHIAGDGWSLDIFQKELLSYCRAYANGDINFELPEPELQYKDFAVWQREYLQGTHSDEQLRFWKEKLSGFENLALPADFTRPELFDYKGSSVEVKVSSENSHQLRALARDLGVTLNSLLLSTVNVLLNKYTGQRDIVTGSPVANRHYRQTEGLIGYFVNTQANRTQLSPVQSFQDLAQQVHQEQLQMQQYQDLPFEKLIAEMGVTRDPSRHPIFQAMFGVQSFGKTNDISDQHYLIRPCEMANVYEVEKFDLSIFVDDGQPELLVHASYATSIFAKETIVKLLEHYLLLLRRLANEPKQKYSKINLLSSEEYNTVVCKWNNNYDDPLASRSLTELFDLQVKLNPDKIALVYEESKLTYGQLDERSNQLATYIRIQYRIRTGEELAPNTLIGIHVGRSLETVVGILAVLKTGAAYVPMDVSYPQERIDFMLADSAAPLVLHVGGQNAIAKIPDEKAINIALTEEYYNKSVTDIGVPINPENLAYVIYTSGTTGTPKGVMVAHASVVNLVQDLQSRYALAANERFLLFSNYIFDASVEQIFLSLLSGSTLFIPGSDTILDSDLFTEYVTNNGITHLDATPTYLNSIDPQGLKKVRRVIFGAEFLSKTLFEKYKTVAPAVYNVYGPTEATVTSLVSKNSWLLNRATIQNTKAYILDQDQNPVPVGIAGELYIAGAGLAKGYLNRPELTSERFINDPFATETDLSNGFDRMYRTGDIVRWLPSGQMEFMGRNDEQVKIRGYRVELGEIENVLSALDGIRHCCVVAKDRVAGNSGNKYLAAYYVADSSNGALPESTIREFLSSRLPEYMVPGVFIRMEVFPMTVNGKLDKQKLPEAPIDEPNLDYVAPVTSSEVLLCGIWQDILGIDKVGTTDDFFMIGGNSIIAIHVVNRMNKLGDYGLRISDLYKLKTIGSIVDYLQQKRIGTNSLLNSYGCDYKEHLNDIIMVHPANAGSEAYQLLAGILADHYNPIGIDNYNLHFNDKISSLQGLAKYYLSCVESEYRLKDPVCLLGWSVGGQIALEMAAILENRGYKNINVFLLDTQLSDQIFDRGLPAEHDQEQVKTMLVQYLRHKKHDESFIEKVVAALPAEHALSLSALSKHLTETRVILFKATKSSFGTKGLEVMDPWEAHYLALPGSNIDKVASNLEVVRLDCNHMNIVETRANEILTDILSRTKSEITEEHSSI